MSKIEGGCEESGPGKPEDVQSQIERKAMRRLWRMADIGSMTRNLVEIERAWEQGDDAIVFDNVRRWGWDSDPMLEALFLDLAHEDEDRAWDIYRHWCRDKASESPEWYRTNMRHANDRLHVHERLRKGLKNSSYGILRAKMWRIAVEEGQAALGCNGRDDEH